MVEAGQLHPRPLCPVSQNSGANCVGAYGGPRIDPNDFGEE